MSEITLKHKMPDLTFQIDSLIPFGKQFTSFVILSMSPPTLISSLMTDINSHCEVWNRQKIVGNPAPPPNN